MLKFMFIKVSKSDNRTVKPVSSVPYFAKTISPVNETLQNTEMFNLDIALTYLLRLNKVQI